MSRTNAKSEQVTGLPIFRVRVVHLQRGDFSSLYIDPMYFAVKACDSKVVSIDHNTHD